MQGAFLAWHTPSTSQRVFTHWVTGGTWGLDISYQVKGNKAKKQYGHPLENKQG
jgi:type II secretory pathway component PulJ